MAYYNTCPYCGGTLDPGEKCDCKTDEKEREDFYAKVIEVNNKTGQMSFCFDRKGERIKHGSGGKDFTIYS